jgi:hypothetical protein
MRRKDWADDEAERLADLMRDNDDYYLLVEEIGKSLRKAAKDFGDHPVTGDVGEHPK